MRTHDDDSDIAEYREDICKTPLLSADEERTLARKVREGDLHARKCFINANMRLAFSIAKRYCGRGLPLSDLVQEGITGLIKAVDRFDLKRGCKFSTYGTRLVEQAIQGALGDSARTIRIPSNMRYLLAMYRKTVSPEVERIENSDARHRAIREKLALKNPPSDELIDILLGTLRGPVKKPILSTDNPEVLGIAAATEDRREFDATATLETLMARLNKQERAILESRFGLNGVESQILSEVGETLGISSERVRQIQVETLAKLRKFAERMNLAAGDID